MMEKRGVITEASPRPETANPATTIKTASDKFEQDLPRQAQDKAKAQLAAPAK